MKNYQDIVEFIEETNNVYEVLKTRVGREFIKMLAFKWNCGTDVFSVEFEKPKYFSGNQVITWNFTLVVNIMMHNRPITFKLPGFSLITIKDADGSSPMVIKYHDSKSGDSIDDLSNAILNNLQKTIEHGSWL